MTHLARTTSGTPLLGTREGYVPLASAHPDLESVEAALPVAAAGDLDPDRATSEPISVASLDLGPPLQDPGSLWGVGLNFGEHAEETRAARPREPAVFLMPPTAAVGPGGPISLPRGAFPGTVTAEAELAVVVGRTCRDVSPDTAETAIAGYLPVIDVTAEELIEENARYLTRAKVADSFLVLGSSIVCTQAADDLAECGIETRVDGESVASAAVSEMRFEPRELVADLSTFVTLQPGDVICTGTPGAGPITAGSEVTARVEDVGQVSASVVEET